MSFQEHFEEISKIKVEDSDTLDDVLTRLGEKLCLCLHVERVNVWVFKQQPNRIECLGNFEKKGRAFTKGEVLYETQIPSYFSHLSSDKSIRIKNVNTSKITSELKDNYCALHRIQAIMDIPVRIEGKLAGVICFEDCKTERAWTDDEKNFALAVSQIVSLTIENQKRKNYQRKLLQALEEKNTLLVEMHHRLKNNLTMLVSLLRLQSRHLTDPDALEVVSGFENQILSISKLHEQLYMSGNFLEVNLKNYLEELVAGFKTSLSSNMTLEASLIDVEINSDKAVTLGLMVNEMLSNAMKHAANNSGQLLISLGLSKQNLTVGGTGGNAILLEISDNGTGFELTTERRESFGLGLIYDLGEQLNASIDFKSDASGTRYGILIGGKG